MLDVVNQAIKEYQIKNDPETVSMATKVKNTAGLKDTDKKQIIGALVSKEDVKRIANKYLKPENLRIVVVGKGLDVSDKLENIDYNL